MNIVNNKETAMQTNVILRTSGDGYWSNVATSVPVTGLNLRFDADADYGELQVFFDTKIWDIDRDGLIYTDTLFLHELKHFLVGELGLSSDVHYSEQGMQGEDYVSLDAGADFIAKWLARVGA